MAGHPGHELKVFGWLAEYQPRVYVITDGSGRSGISRIPSTAALLQNARARSGDIFGAISDAEIYRENTDDRIVFLNNSLLTGKFRLTDVT